MNGPDDYTPSTICTTDTPGGVNICAPSTTTATTLAARPLPHTGYNVEPAYLGAVVFLTVGGLLVLAARKLRRT